MNCPHCDNVIPDGSKFCGHCGKRISEDDVRKTMAFASPLLAPRPTAPSNDDPRRTMAFGAALTFGTPAPALAEKLPHPAARKALDTPDAPLAVENVSPVPASQSATVVVDSGYERDAEAAAANDTVAEPAVAQAFVEPTAPEPVANEPTVPAVEPVVAAPAPVAAAPEPAATPKADTVPVETVTAAPKKKPGGFRETMWFMESVDPDSMAAAEQADIRVRADKFKDGDKAKIDQDVRKQFSLSAEESAASNSKLQRVRADLDRADRAAKKGSAAPLIIGALLLAAIGGAAWFFVLR